MSEPVPSIEEVTTRLPWVRDFLRDKCDSFGIAIIDGALHHMASLTKQLEEAREAGAKARLDYRGNLESLWLIVMANGGEMVVPDEKIDLSRIVVFTTYEKGKLRLRAKLDEPDLSRDAGAEDDKP